MSTNYTSKKLAFNNAEQFKESFYEPEPTTIGYVFIGKHIAWSNESSPDSISDTVYDEKTVWDNMYAAKKITGNDVELVVPRVDWTANTKYRAFDDTIPLSDLITANTAQNLKPVYIINSERSVYLCLSNNISANSTVEPTGKNLSANGNIATADGYLWKYMYNVKPTNKFLSNVWVPAPISTSKLDYDVSDLTVVDGELPTIIVTNGGSGYIHSNITATAFTSGCSTLTLANTTNVVANMAISGTGITGQTFISSIDAVNNKITLSSATSSAGGGLANANTLFISTRVGIFGDGTSAIASPTLSGNSISKITLSSYGKNYTKATVAIYGTGTNAAARAILSPKFGHGYNAAKEIGASNVMISMRIGEVDTTEDGVISANTTFRQYGFLRDPYKYGQSVQANTATANTVVSQTTNVTLIAGTSFELDEFVYQGASSSSPTFSGYVNAYSANEVRLTNVVGSISVGGLLKGTVTNPTGRTVVSLQSPEFQPYTGDILYVENITKTQRTDGQAENLKFVVRF